MSVTVSVSQNTTAGDNMSWPSGGWTVGINPITGQPYPTDPKGGSYPTGGGVPFAPRTPPPSWVSAPQTIYTTSTTPTITTNPVELPCIYECECGVTIKAADEGTLGYAIEQHNSLHLYERLMFNLFSKMEEVMEQLDYLTTKVKRALDGKQG